MKRFTFILFLIAFLVFPSNARADVAPPINPPGSNLQPGDESMQVRMMSETVLIEVKRDTTQGSLGSAHITATFIMRNLGASDESMAVRFPVSANDGRGQYPEIRDIVARVDGQKSPIRRVNYPDARYQSESVPWVEFDVTFPVNQDVKIEVAYNLDGSGYFPYTAFYYILATGAGWKDTIGSADVILRLPYEASPHNIVLNMPIGWAETTPGGSIQGNEIRWHFKDFEPGPYEVVENMEFALVAPAAWQTVIEERNNTAKSPNDGEAWGRLGKAYKDIFLMNKAYRSDLGGEELYQASVEAYEKCLSLLPKDAQWHAGFAELLAGRAYWDSFMDAPTPEIFRALKEIHTALDLAPNDPIVRKIAQNIFYMFPDGMIQSGTGYDFPWLTATPSPLPPTPTIVPVYDPALVAGTYQTDLLTLVNGKHAQLTLTLGTDHFATLESKGDNDQVIISTGTWEDLGDSSIQVVAEDSTMKRTLLLFSLEDGNLRSIQYPAFYGEAGMNMHRLVTATPTPEVQSTATSNPSSSTPVTTTSAVESQPTATPNQPSATPAPAKPFLPFCGSAAMLPLVVIVLLWRRK